MDESLVSNTPLRPTAAVLAIDGGNSKTDVALVAADGTLLASVRGGPSNHQGIGWERATKELTNLVASAAEIAGLPGVKRVAQHTSACLAGADLPVEEADLNRLVQSLGWSATSTVVNDTFAVLRAGLADAGPHWGIGVVCGAGINCVGVAPDGRTTRFLSLGELSGDWGGGGALGPLALWWPCARRTAAGRRPSCAPRCLPTSGWTASRMSSSACTWARLTTRSSIGWCRCYSRWRARGTRVARDIVLRQATEICLMVTVAARRLDLLATRGVPVVLGAIADVNGDGNLDLIVTGADPNSHNWSYSVLLGNGDGSFQSPTLYQQNVQAVPSMIVIADFNNDGKPDFALPVGNSVAVLLGNGDGTFGTLTLFFDGEADSIVSADFNGDGKLDIAAGGASGLAILLGNGSGTFQPAAFPYTTGLDVVATADLNGDGKADIVANSNGIQILLGNGDGTFNALAPFDSGNSAIALADVNGDGNVDVIAEEALGSTVHNGIFLGNGDGTFDPSEIFIPYNYPPHFQFPTVQAADMNGDGKPDLIIESPVSTVFALLNSTPPVPGTRFSPTSVTFPSQLVGTSSNSAPVILTNPGTVALTVTSVTLSGANAGEFKQTNNCTTVQPLANCTIKVMFAPTAAGGLSANLVIVDDAFSGSQQIAVSGTAVVPGFSLSAAALSPASVSTGGSATTTIAIASVGGFNQTVTLACGSIMLNGSPAATAPPTCKFSPSSVSNASGTSTLTLSTTGPSAALVPVSTRSRGLFYAMLLPILGIAVLGTRFNSSRKNLLRTSLACLMISGLLFLAACGGGNSGVGGVTSTPAGTYTISILGSAGSVVAKPITVTLIVQ